MAEVANLKKLKRFGCRLADVSGEGIQHLAGLTELTRLELRETSIDDGSLNIIGNLSKLEYLDISECRTLKGKTIGELGKLTGLKYLELREIKKVRDDNFAALGTLTNLTELNLEATQITDKSAPTLLKMQKLERLSVAGSQMGDEGMVQLSQLPALKWLNLRNSLPKPETIAALKAAKPGIEILE
jgi:F-box/leucine-rich repeat protein 14